MPIYHRPRHVVSSLLPYNRPSSDGLQHSSHIAISLASAISPRATVTSEMLVHTGLLLEQISFILAMPLSLHVNM